MQNTSKKISDADLALYTKAFAAFGGEILEIIDGEKVVIAFDSVDRMMKVIDGLKECNKAFKFNSKKGDDGRHVCTMFRT